MVSKKQVFSLVLSIQAIVILYLILTNAVSFDITGYTYAWFYNSNQVTVLQPNKTAHVCMPLKPKVNYKQGEIFILLLVMSQSLHEDRREAIRTTWASSLAPGHKQSENIVNLIFVIGCTRSVHLDRDVDREAKLTPDILRLPFNEDQKKFEIRRTLVAYEVASHYKPKYIVKTQDDVYVHLPKLLTWLKGETKTVDMYAGKIHTKAPVHRDPTDPYFVSKKEFSSKTFPDYCSGVFYIVSGDLLKRILEMEKKEAKFNVEDAFIGVVVSKLRIEPIDIGNSVIHIDGRTSKAVQSWKNEIFQDMFAIGYDLLPNTLQYIHDRHKRIVNRQDTVH